MHRSPRYLLIIIVVSFMLLSAFANLHNTNLPISRAADSSGTEAEDTADGSGLGDALASVNGVLINPDAFQEAFARISPNSAAAEQTALALDVLHSLINQELITQFAEEIGVKIHDDDVEQEIASMQVAIGDLMWDKWLEQSNYSESEFRKAVRQQLINNAVRDHVTGSLNGIMNHVHARHILVATEREARDIVNRVQAGQNFASLAARFSRDVTTRDDGGDLSWFVRGELLDDRLAELAFALEVGETAGPIATRLGFHIMQKLGEELRLVEAERKPFLAQNIFNLWLDDQVRMAEIVLNLEALAKLSEVSD